MKHKDGLADGWVERWRPAIVPTVATGLVLLERVLMDEMGSPPTLLRALGDLGRPWTDPVASVLAVMALTAETLVGYVLVVLVLGSLGKLPGSMGRLAARLTSLITPVAVRRLLDLLVGGALLAQTALAVPPGASHGHRWSASQLGATASSPVSGSLDSSAMRDAAPTSLGTGWLDRPADGTDPVGARPNSRRSAAPLPPWLGGGPSNAAPAGDDEEAATLAPRHGAKAGRPTAPRQRDKAGDTTAHGHTVEVGDTLWDIAAARLAPAERSAANIHRYWRQLYRANRSAIGPDPDLIHPGTRLDVPPFRGAGR
jgi:LysM domain